MYIVCTINLRKEKLSEKRKICFPFFSTKMTDITLFTAPAIGILAYQTIFFLTKTEKSIFRHFSREMPENHLVHHVQQNSALKKLDSEKKKSGFLFFFGWDAGGGGGGGGGGGTEPHPGSSLGRKLSFG